MNNYIVQYTVNTYRIQGVITEYKYVRDCCIDIDIDIKIFPKCIYKMSRDGKAPLYCVTHGP
jgi:hypothetical protein